MSTILLVKYDRSVGGVVLGRVWTVKSLTIECNSRNMSRSAAVSELHRRRSSCQIKELYPPTFLLPVAEIMIGSPSISPETQVVLTVKRYKYHPFRTLAVVNGEVDLDYRSKGQRPPVSEVRHMYLDGRCVAFLGSPIRTTPSQYIVSQSPT